MSVNLKKSIILFAGIICGMITALAVNIFFQMSGSLKSNLPDKEKTTLITDSINPFTRQISNLVQLMKFDDAIEIATHIDSEIYKRKWDSDNRLFLAHLNLEKAYTQYQQATIDSIAATALGQLETYFANNQNRIKQYFKNLDSLGVENCFLYPTIIDRKFKEYIYFRKYIANSPFAVRLQLSQEYGETATDNLLLRINENVYTPYGYGNFREKSFGSIQRIHVLSQ